jgi:hypothetical protein
MGRWPLTKATRHGYTPTEAKYKGGAAEMYVTYDLSQRTRGGDRALYPKVQRLYVAGKVKDWHVGTFARRTGKKVHGVRIDYEQSRGGYERQAYTASRGGTRYRVGPAKVGKTSATFSKVVEVPEDAMNVRFHADKLPAAYRAALQDVR